jgi:hypothetical protein
MTPQTRIIGIAGAVSTGDWLDKLRERLLRYQADNSLLVAAAFIFPPFSNEWEASHPKEGLGET